MYCFFPQYISLKNPPPLQVIAMEGQKSGNFEKKKQKKTEISTTHAPTPEALPRSQRAHSHKSRGERERERESAMLLGPKVAQEETALKTALKSVDIAQGLRALDFQRSLRRRCEGAINTKVERGMLSEGSREHLFAYRPTFNSWKRTPTIAGKRSHPMWRNPTLFRVLLEAPRYCYCCRRCVT